MNRRIPVVVALALVIAATGSAWAHEGHVHTIMGTVMGLDAQSVQVKTPGGETLSIATNGEVKFGEDVRFGDFLVKKAKYVLEHRVDGERHTIVLTAVTKAEKAPVVYDVATQTVVSKTTVKKSAVYAAEGADHLLRVSVVQIAGENVDHLAFSSAVPATQ